MALSWSSKRHLLKAGGIIVSENTYIVSKQARRYCVYMRIYIYIYIPCLLLNLLLANACENIELFQMVHVANLI